MMNTHNTIVLEWDENGTVTYCRTFDLPGEVEDMRAAASELSRGRRCVMGSVDGILNLSMFKEDEDRMLFTPKL